jgi:hypothetical protein
MRNNRSFLATAIGLLVIITLALPTTAATPEVEPIVVNQGKAQQPISLRDRLIVGLQARLKSEVAFCEAVTMEVNLGHLPLRVVDETFLWARQRAQSQMNVHQYRPIIYFQLGMRLRAQKLNVTLPKSQTSP